MRKRGGAGSRAQKKRARPRKLDPLKVGRSGSIATSSCPTCAELKVELARVTHERAEALQQQTATANVLKVISRSTFDLQFVLNTLVESAARLCEADQANIARPGSDGFFLVAATYGLSPQHQTDQRSLRFKPERGTLIGRVLLKGGPVHIEDAATDPEYTLALAQKLGGFHSMLGVPLMREGIPIGVFGLGRKELRPFTEKQVELLTTFAAQAVIAIENARLLNELRQRTADLSEALEQQTATSDVLKIIASSPNDLQPVFDTILENATHLCEATHGHVWRFDGEQLHAVAVRGDERFVRWLRQHNPVRPIAGSAAERIVRGARLVHVADRREEDAYRSDQTFRQLVDKSGIRASLSIRCVAQRGRAVRHDQRLPSGGSPVFREAD
jgi:transcriptional regulator with GAF, ATPase, and Fis domain